MNEREEYRAAHRAESEANARLIAAAPQLLAALKRAERRMELQYAAQLSAPMFGQPRTTQSESLGDDLFAARAAIAKAEGRA